MKRLDEIEARANAASPGPWFDEERNLDEPWDLTTVYYGFHNGETPDRDLVAEAAYDNAEFIAHARQDVPALVAALRAVLELHPRAGVVSVDPERGLVEDEAVCAECIVNYEPAPWPCPTVAAIRQHLGEDA